MADQKRASGTGDGPRRQRQAPTIDLTATDVTPPQDRDKATAAQPDSAKPDSAKPDTGKPEAGQSDPRQPESNETASSAGETPTREFLSQAEQADGGNGSAGSAAKPVSRLPYVVAGLAGGALVAAVLFALWLTGTVPIRYAGSTAMRARVAGLEMQVQGLTDQFARRAPVADSKTLDELGARLGKAEQAIASLPAGTDPALADRVATTENALKAVGVALSALNTRVEQLASSLREARAGADTGAVTALAQSLDAVKAEADALRKQVDALAQDSKATQDKVAQNTGADGPARLAIAAVALRDAVVRGDPYAAQLDAVKALGADAGTLAPLAAFAQAGVPDNAVLSAELRALLPGMVKAAGTGSNGAQGFLDRLQANAEKLVRVRPVDAPSGSDAGAVLARLDVMTARNDVAGARAELDKLPSALRAQADAWTKKVAARQAAVDASRTLAADAARALGKPSGKS